MHTASLAAGPALSNASQASMLDRASPEPEANGGARLGRDAAGDAHPNLDCSISSIATLLP